MVQVLSCEKERERERESERERERERAKRKRERGGERERESTHLPTHPSTHTHSDTHTHTVTHPRHLPVILFAGDKGLRGRRPGFGPLSLRSDLTGHRGLGEQSDQALQRRQLQKIARPRAGPEAVCLLPAAAAPSALRMRPERRQWQSQRVQGCARMQPTDLWATSECSTHRPASKAPLPVPPAPVPCPERQSATGGPVQQWLVLERMIPKG